MGNAQARSSARVCVCVYVLLDEQNAEEELELKNDTPFRARAHTHSLTRGLKEQFVRGLILEIVQ